MSATPDRWKLFMQKLRFKYRLSILNENTLEETWHVRLSRIRVYMYITLFLLVTFVLLTLLIIFTPIKYYLPGYAGLDGRTEIIAKSMQIDSLLIQMDYQSTYLQVLKTIMSGELVDDPLLSSDTIGLKERAEIIMEKSRAERLFVEEYERQEQFNLTALSNREGENLLVFFKPVKGVISSSFDMRDNRFGVAVLTAFNEPVLSVLPGTVIYAGFTFENGWVISVQHSDDYISVYKNNTNLLKRSGDQLKAGEVIAFTGEDPTKKNGKPFVFELWKSGQALNPEDFILF